MTNAHAPWIDTPFRLPKHAHPPTLPIAGTMNIQIIQHEYSFQFSYMNIHFNSQYKTPWWRTGSKKRSRPISNSRRREIPRIFGGNHNNLWRHAKFKCTVMSAISRPDMISGNRFLSRGLWLFICSVLITYCCDGWWIFWAIVWHGCRFIIPWKDWFEIRYWCFFYLIEDREKHPEFYYRTAKRNKYNVPNCRQFLVPPSRAMQIRLNNLYCETYLHGRQCHKTKKLWFEYNQVPAWKTAVCDTASSYWFYIYKKITYHIFWISA